MAVGDTLAGWFSASITVGMRWFGSSRDPDLRTTKLHAKAGWTSWTVTNPSTLTYLPP
jgi:hypothetical protein